MVMGDCMQDIEKGSTQGVMLGLGLRGNSDGYHNVNGLERNTHFTKICIGAETFGLGQSLQSTKESVSAYAARSFSEFSLVSCQPRPAIAALC